MGPEVGPEQIAADFWRAYQAETKDRAVSLATSSSAPLLYEHQAETMDLYEVEVGTATIGTRTAGVPTILVLKHSPDPRPIRFVTRLMLEDGEWRVDYVTTGPAMQGARRFVYPPRT